MGQALLRGQQPVHDNFESNRHRATKLMRSHLQRIEEPPRGGTVLDRLSRNDIEDFTSRNAVRDGERYWQQGRVLSLTMEQDGTRIEARVRGSQGHPYSLTIEIAEVNGDDLDVMGECSCPVGFNCKHVAAALFAAMAHTPQRATPAAPAKRGRAGGSPDLFADLKPSRAPPAEVLDPGLASWIDALARIERTETEDYPPDVRQRLVYVLDVAQRDAGVPHIVAMPTSVRLLKDGRFSDKTSAFNPENVLQTDVAKFIRPSDRGILKRLHAMKYAVPVRTGTALVDEDGVTVLDAMIATGRARLGSIAGPVVTQGPARTGLLVWRLAENGAQYPDFAIEEAPGARVLRLAPPWYVETATAVMGPVETGFAARIAAGILSAPAVPTRQGKLLRAAIARRLPALTTIEPPELEPPQRIDGPAVPSLRLMVVDLPRPSYLGYGLTPSIGSSQSERVPIARLFYRYAGVDVRADDARDCPTFARDGRIVEVVRDRIAEHKAVARLSGLGFEQLSNQYPYGISVVLRNDFVLADDEDGAGWIDVLYHDMPALRAAGWEIEIAADFPVHLVRADGDISAELHEGSGIDWFELDLGALVDGERIDLVPAILAAIASPTFSVRAVSDPSDEDLPLYLPLGDGRILAVAAARLRPILGTLHELFTAGTIDAKAKRLAFSSRDAVSITEFEAATSKAGIVWRGGEQLRELGRMLRETGSIPRAELPSSFTATLRPYQARGVDWLQFLRAAGLGGVLADDMGLGKTVQALAYLAIEKASGRMDRPALVVAPTSVLANWRREAERFVPDLKVLTLHGLDRRSRFGEIAEHDLVLTTYPLLARDHTTLQAQHWHVVVLDEAQVIKNPDAATTQFVFALEAQHRLCLTGTPLENHLGEVWSLFAFLSPGLLGDRQSFKRHWRTPIEKRGDADRRRLLARRIRPFLLRRTKTEVAPELPSKTEIIESIEMDLAQRDLYESIRLSMHAKVQAAIAAQGLARSRIVVLDALLKLRQACCDPRLLKLKDAVAGRVRSAKLDRLMEILPELVDEGRRVLLFSQFTSMLALIEDALRAAAIRYVLLTGDTRDRETPIRRFQGGEVPLFLISLKAGGLGLNLTAADTVIHYDPWWNPAVEDQATDRAHRLGQDKPVFVHKLVMLASIEEKIEVLKTRKRDLAAGLFNPDAGSALDLTEADIDDLFALA
jgi:superfamily II DNA or RNA helicase